MCSPKRPDGARSEFELTTEKRARWVMSAMASSPKRLSTLVPREELLIHQPCTQIHSPGRGHPHASHRLSTARNLHSNSLVPAAHRCSFRGSEKELAMPSQVQVQTL